ncbi:MAG: hypothetical protein WKF53_09905 [Rubrobacter sp.]
MSETTKEDRERSHVPGMMGRDRLLPLYDPLCRLLGMARVHRPLVDQAAVRPGHRVLEIGCGTGNLSYGPFVFRQALDAEVEPLERKLIAKGGIRPTGLRWVGVLGAKSDGKGG